MILEASGFVACLLLMLIAAYVVSRPTASDAEPPARQSYACPKRHEWAVVLADEAPPRCGRCARVMWKTQLVTPENSAGRFWQPEGDRG